MESDSELSLSALLPLAQGSVAADEYRLSQALTAFAQDNGFLYAQRAEGVLPRYDPGNSPAWFGFEGPLIRKRVQHHMTGRFMGLEIELFELVELSVAEDENPITTGIIRVFLPSSYPHILLDSNKNDYQRMGSIRAAYGERYRVILEGDFSHYFELYAVQDAPIDVRVILAPNMMDMLVRSSHRFDIELFDNKLILMTSDSLYNPHVMRDAVQALREQLLYLQRLQQNRSIRGPFSHMKRSLVDGESMIIFGRKIPMPHFMGGLLIIVGVLTIITTLSPSGEAKSPLAYLVPPILIIVGIAAWRSGR